MFLTKFVLPTGYHYGRHLNTTSLLFKKHAGPKKGKQAKNQRENVDKDNGNKSNIQTDPQELLSQLKIKLGKTLTIHQDKLNQILQNDNRQSTVFDNLKLSNGTKFTDLATTSVKGKSMLLVTVFNPLDVKRIISLILGANLNLTPERVNDNDQLLKVSLPPKTKEYKIEQDKQMKKVSDDCKNSKFFWSLSSIRREFLDKFKKLYKNDEIDANLLKKYENTLNELQKDYGEKIKQQYEQNRKKLV